MASTSETGHTINVAHFETLISRCAGFGTDYNPSKTEIKLPALGTLLTSSQTALTNLTTAETAYINAVNPRSIIFHPLKPLSTRIINALAATDATPELIKDAKTLNRKIQGQRAGKKTPPVQPPAIPLPPGTIPPSTTQISVSQQSFDSLLKNFNKLVDLVSSEATYTPNETELKVLALTNLATDLAIKNTAVINATTDLLNARAVRTKTLYLDKTGLFDIAAQVKKYVKSASTASNPMFNQVKGIKFTKSR